ncbi:MAG TPA: ribosome silencing factor [Vicinamibacteria bacterium]
MKLPGVVAAAAQAALDKKAEDVVVLDLRKVSSFTDYFVLATGTNQKQILAIADSVLEVLRARGLRPDHSEGYPRQEWILLDFGGLVVHVFTPRLRAFYDLERLWGGATRMEMRGLPAPPAPPPAPPST